MAAADDATEEKKPFFLPEDYTPGPYTVIIIGRCKRNHTGNKLLARIVKDELKNWKATEIRSETSILLHRIVNAIKRSNEDNVGFVKRDRVSGRWQELTEFASRAVVARCFRDELGETDSRTYGVSKKKTKQQKRQLMMEEVNDSGISSGGAIKASSVFSSLPPLPGCNKKGEGLSVDDAIAVARNRNKALKGILHPCLHWKDSDTSKSCHGDKTKNSTAPSSVDRSSMRAPNPRMRVLDLQMQQHHPQPRSNFGGIGWGSMRQTEVAPMIGRFSGVQPRLCPGYHGNKKEFQPWNSVGMNSIAEGPHPTSFGGMHHINNSFTTPDDLGPWDSECVIPCVTPDHQRRRHYHQRWEPGSQAALHTSNSYNLMDAIAPMDLVAWKRVVSDDNPLREGTAFARSSLPTATYNSQAKTERGRIFAETKPRRQLDPPAQRLDR